MTMDNNQLFVEYYKEWVSIYKEGAIRPITLSKYKMAISWLEKLVPNLKLCDLDNIRIGNLDFDIKNCFQKEYLREYEGIENILKAIENAKARLRANVNFDLVMELLLLTIKEN